MDVNSSRSGRKLFIILALVVTVGLGLGAYVVGNSKRNETDKQSQPTQSQASNTPKPSQQPANNNPTPPPSTNPPANNQPALTPNPSTSPIAGATSVPNTGPEDAYPVFVAAIVLFSWYYVRSRHSIRRSALGE